MVLAEVAARLTCGARSTDTVARIGGDEFVVVCPGVAGRGDVTVIAQKMRESLVPEIALPEVMNGGHQLPVSVRVGVSIGISFGVGGDDPEMLLRDADRAMYLVKNPARSPL